MQFIAPKNFKNGRNILSRFKIPDLIFLIITGLLSFVLAIGYVSLSKNKNIIIIFLFVVPPSIAYLLTMPFGIHHNVLTFLKVILRFLRSKKKYYWEGIAKNEKDRNEEKNDFY